MLIKTVSKNDNHDKFIVYIRTLKFAYIKRTFTKTFA